jgi:hypothetical protein
MSKTRTQTSAGDASSRFNRSRLLKLQEKLVSSDLVIFLRTARAACHQHERVQHLACRSCVCSLACKMLDQTSRFTCMPLGPNIPGCFRLLELHSAGLRSDVRCTLFHSSCLDAEYEALSYVWGEPIFTNDILLSNQAFHVTENLYSALNHLRYLDKSRILWADAICIK